MARIVVNLNLSLIEPCLGQSLKNSNFSKEYYEKLLEAIELTQKKLGYYEEVFNEEGEVLKNTAREFEEAAQRGENFKHIFGMENALVEIDPDISPEKLTALNKMLDSEFFQEFYKIIDPGIDDLIDAATLSAQKNDPEIYNKARSRFLELEGQYLKPEHTLMGTINLLFQEVRGDPVAKKKRVVELCARTYLSVALPNYSNSRYLLHLPVNRLRVLLGAVAIKMYELDNGVLPDDLKQLVPKYLSSVPQDDFNDFKDLSYKKTEHGFKLYSFGPDKKDDGGEVIFDLEKFQKDHTQDAGDLVFSY